MKLKVKHANVDGGTKGRIRGNMDLMGTKFRSRPGVTCDFCRVVINSELTFLLRPSLPLVGVILALFEVQEGCHVLDRAYLDKSIPVATMIKGKVPCLT